MKKTCADCIHYDACKDMYDGIKEDFDDKRFIGCCDFFKNKSDVVEVKHGEWIGVADYRNGNCIAYCSVCGTTQRTENPTSLKMFHKYCRWCGAKMDGKGGAE